MKVSQSQFEAFSAQAEAQFIDELSKHIRTSFPSRFATKGGPSVLDVARRTVQLGNEYAVTRRVDLLTLAECLLSLDRPTSAESVLRRTDLSGREKVALLHDYLVFKPA